MALWTVSYVGNDGQKAKLSIAAESAAEARDKSGIHGSRILSVSPSFIGAISEKLTAPRVSIENQILLLSSLAAMAAAGENIDDALRSLIRGDRVLRKLEPKFESATLTSDRLRMMAFDTEAVLLTQVGEKSGSLSNSLLIAAKQLMVRKKMLAGIGKGLLPGVILMLAGLAALTGLPLVFEKLILEFKNTPDLSIKTGLATDILLGVSHVVRNYWTIAVAVIIGIVVFHRPLWVYARKIPILSMVEDYFLHARALRFLSAYRPLSEAGINVYDALMEMRRDSGFSDRAVYQQMLDSLKAGSSFSQTIDTPAWPEIIRRGMRNFENADPEKRLVIIDNILDLLMQRLEMISGTLSRVSYFIGMMMALAAIAIIVLGAMLPLISVK